MNYPKIEKVGTEQKCEDLNITFPPQHQDTQPGFEHLMNPRPLYENPNYTPSNKLINKVMIITGGDSGIGRAVSVLFAKEGADIAIVYLDERQDAAETKSIIESLGRKCLLIEGDASNEDFCIMAIEKTISTFNHLDIVINNAAIQFPKQSILEITKEQIELTFKTNVFSYFYMIKAALPHLKTGDSIINTASVTAYAGEETLIDYSATKGAIVTLTRSLALSLVNQEIRVNSVSPGPIWTPLIPASFEANRVKNFGATNPMKRAGQPFEVAPAYLYLASDDSRYVTGQSIHVNGGYMITT